MSGFLLHIGGPLQSWGEHSAFNDRDTLAHPSRSGLIGMMAAALGITREQAVSDPGVGSPAASVGESPSNLFGRLGGLRFTVRHDRPGVRLRDFHTVGGGFPVHRTVPTAKGGRRTVGGATIVSHRHYLADAVFIVAVTAPDDPEIVALCARALAAPRWPLHLGRRSCPPGALLLLASDVADPVADLLHAVPLARHRPTESASGTRSAPSYGNGAMSPATVSVRFTADTPFSPAFASSSSARPSVTTLNDEPVRLKPLDRVYRSRPSYTTSCLLPVELCHGYGIDYLDALTRYLTPRPPEGTEA
ncbi:type I-E CRISPR-associated protein Cas5/CasD [Streptomyces cyaneofuscatus]|uniref:type I-E CRISPR-associated protein Cas5/CasD n=1 Tax=Streptomyces cyaneofuscatus TaxID=66883 RepID=UPI00340BEA6F